MVVWTYASDGIVLTDAAAHVWLPVREAAAEGLDHLGAWFRGEREGPVNVLYRPVLREEATGEELPKPRRLFEAFD